MRCPDKGSKQRRRSKSVYPCIIHSLTNSLTDSYVTLCPARWEKPGTKKCPRGRPCPWGVHRLLGEGPVKRHIQPSILRTMRGWAGVLTHRRAEGPRRLQERGVAGAEQRRKGGTPCSSSHTRFREAVLGRAWEMVPDVVPAFGALRSRWGAGPHPEGKGHHPLEGGEESDMLSFAFKEDLAAVFPLPHHSWLAPFPGHLWLWLRSHRLWSSDLPGERGPSHLSAPYFRFTRAEQRGKASPGQRPLSQRPSLWQR